MSTSASCPPPPPPPSPSRTPYRAVSAPPPAPVRLAIVLLWVKVAFWALSAAVLLLVPAVRDRYVVTTGDPSQGMVVAGLVLVGIALLMATLAMVAWTAVVAAFLGRGRRWARTVVLVLASLTALVLGRAVVASVVFQVSGYHFSDVPPSPFTVAYFAVSVLLYAAVLVLLFRPGSRRWLDERTAQHRWAARQRRAAMAGGAR